MSFSFLARGAHGRKRATTLLAGVAVAALLAACGSSGGSTASGNTNTPAGTDTAATGAGTAATGTDTGTANGGTTSGSGATAAELASAQSLVEGWRQSMTAADFPAPTKLTKTPDVKGKTVYLVPLSYTIPVIHGIVTGVQQALTKVGANYKVCDGGAGGQPNPTLWGNCLKQAGDAKAGAVMTFFIDYKAVSTQFDALAKAGVPTLIAGVPADGTPTKTGLMDFYDASPGGNALFANLSVLALAKGGANTNILWLRLLDSTATTGQSDAGVAQFKKICANCGITTVDFTTANSQAQLAASVSAALVKNPAINMVAVPVDSYTPLVIQGIQQAGKTGKVQYVSQAGSLDTFQRIKAGQQIATLSSPMILTGWQYANGLMQLLAGMPVEKGAQAFNRIFDASNVNSIKLNANEVLTDDWFTTGQPYMDGFLSAWGLN